MRTRWKIAAGVAAGVLAWWLFGDDEASGVLGDVRQIFRDAVNGITQGQRLTHCPYDKTTGVAPCDPQQLADQAGLDLDTYALARMIASEEGGSTPAVQALVAHAIKNSAAAHGKTIAAWLLRANEPTHSGFFGTYKNIDAATSGYDKPDRDASTALDPYDGHAAVAQGVQDGTIPDLTNGATQFDRTTHENADYVAAKRTAAGEQLVTGLEDIEGIGDLRFWTKSQGAGA